MKNLYIIALIGLTMVSCGKSKAELELEKARIELEKTKLELAAKDKTDSIEKIRANDLTKQKQIQAANAEKQRIHQQKVNVGIKKRRNKLNEQLEQMEAALIQAEKNYNEVNSFQIGRSQSDKNKQLSQAQQQINLVENYIAGLKKAIAEAELSQTFAFQNTPQGVVKYIFNAAKNRDFSKLKYLCDPYAENDADSNGICLTAILPYQQQEQFATTFENGRIIGNPKINGNTAEVEFAFGQNSNRLEKMKLIKRLDKWYISDL